jgi:hypothetical protein
MLMFPLLVPTFYIGGPTWVKGQFSIDLPLELGYNHGMNNTTIEPDYKTGGYAVYEHGEYPEGSVLAGQYRRTLRGLFPTIAEARSWHPMAEVLDHGTKPWRMGNETLEELSGLPECPPDWFDPMDAGESW